MAKNKRHHGRIYTTHKGMADVKYWFIDTPKIERFACVRTEEQATFVADACEFHEDLIAAAKASADILYNRYGIRVNEGTPSSAVLEQCLKVLSKADPCYAEFLNANPGIEPEKLPF